MPTSTYRLQLQPGFTFDRAAEQAEYLTSLGVSHAYLSPVLQAVPGSTHGYDVVDHGHFNAELGGTEFTRLCRTFGLFGVGVVVDVVPNHMATPTPAWLNRQWWSLLAEGRESQADRWFDVDWDAEGGRVLVPVLGAPLEEELAAGSLGVARDGGPRSDEWVVRYHEHEFPVRTGTETLDLPALLEAQHYVLAHWREGVHRLNYRRFFDVTTLAAVRVEDPEVFEATHRLLLDTVESGLVEGLRIDHPDGLADPGGYLARLADATGDAWVVAEKILEGDEALPDDWRCAGTTGYDALARVQHLFHDPEGERGLTAAAEAFLGEAQDLGGTIEAAKEQVVAEVLPAEVNRLMRLVARVLPWGDQDSLRRALVALLVSMDRYRGYLGEGVADSTEGLAVVTAAEQRAQQRVAERDLLSLSVIAELARGGRLPEAALDSGPAQEEFVQRFQQTCGPVMAKGIEDTAFYRYVRLTGLNEVGGDPGRIGLAPEDFHRYAAERLESWPLTMTTLSTHDTKRSEDVRARLAVLSELPQSWERWVTAAHDLAGAHRAPAFDSPTEYLLWQALVGAWPITTERFSAYATKAVREAKVHTSWSDPDAAFEEAVDRFARGVTTDPAIGRHVEGWLAMTASATRANILGQKLVQLTMPGVPDVYQGCEVVDLSLVDPDNRRPVDFAERSARLARLDRGEPPRDLDDAKLLVTSSALRLRRERPEWFVGPTTTYQPVATSTPHAFSFARGDEGGPRAVTVVTRLASSLEDAGGWGQATIDLPRGDWMDVLTGRDIGAGGGPVPVTAVLADLPVALLAPTGLLERDVR